MNVFSDMLDYLLAMFTAANYAYICNVFEGVADLGDNLVFRYILPKHSAALIW